MKITWKLVFFAPAILATSGPEHHIADDICFVKEMHPSRSLSTDKGARGVPQGSNASGLEVRHQCLGGACDLMAGGFRQVAEPFTAATLGLMTEKECPLPEMIASLGNMAALCYGAVGLWGGLVTQWARRAVPGKCAQLSETGIAQLAPGRLFDSNACTSRENGQDGLMGESFRADEQEDTEELLVAKHTSRTFCGKGRVPSWTESCWSMGLCTTLPLLLLTVGSGSRLSLWQFCTSASRRAPQGLLRDLSAIVVTALATSLLTHHIYMYAICVGFLANLTCTLVCSHAGKAPLWVIFMV